MQNRYSRSSPTTRSSGSPSASGSGSTNPYGATYAAAKGRSSPAAGGDRQNGEGGAASQNGGAASQNGGAAAGGGSLSQRASSAVDSMLASMESSINKILPGTGTKFREFASSFTDKIMDGRLSLQSLSSGLSGLLSRSAKYAVTQMKTSDGFSVKAGLSAGKKYMLGSAKSAVKTSAKKAAWSALEETLQESGLMNPGKKGWNYYQTRKNR